METNKLVISREELIQIINDNDGHAKGLDLSGHRFSIEDDYSNLNLQGIILTNTKLAECNLRGVDLSEAILDNANLERIHLEGALLFNARMKGTDLVNARLEGANLSFANLDESYLIGAHLEGADLSATTLYGANLNSTCLQGSNFNIEFTPDIDMGNANWGNFKLYNENDNNFRWAVDDYRKLKTWYSREGYYNVAGKFFYREMETKRKAQSWRKEPHLKIWNWTMRMLSGYGEKPERVVISAALVILMTTIIYFLIGSTWQWSAFWSSLYFSAVSFTALGYGSWVITTSDWMRGLGAAESFVGVFMMALFLVTFTRKMTR